MDDQPQGVLRVPPVAVSEPVPAAPAEARSASAWPGRLALAGLISAFAAFYLPWLSWSEAGYGGSRQINVSGGELAHAAGDLTLWLPLAGALLGLAAYGAGLAWNRRRLAAVLLWIIAAVTATGGGYSSLLRPAFAPPLSGVAALSGYEAIKNGLATLPLDGRRVRCQTPEGVAGGAAGTADADSEAAVVRAAAGCGVWVGGLGWLMVALGAAFLGPRRRPPVFSFARHAPLLSLLALVVASTFLSDAFPKTQNLLNIARQVATTGIIALGMTFVIVGAGIDLSVGSMTALTGAGTLVAVNAAAGAGMNGWTAAGIGAAAALAGGALLGALNGLLVTAGRVAPFIATLGTMSIFRSLALRWGNAGEFTSDSELLGEVGMAGWLPLGGWPEGIGGAAEKAAYLFTPATAGNLYIPLPVWTLLAAAALLSLLLDRTRFGRHLCAVGSSERVALYAGVRVNLTRLAAYVIAGVTVGLSGFLYAARFNSLATTNAGNGYELDAIAAVIMGGTPLSGGRGAVWGTVIGALLLGIIGNMLTMMGVSTYWQGAVKGLAILAAVLLQRRAPKQ